MSLKFRFRFDGRCTRHPRYNPKRDGRPPDAKCEGCDSLYVIHFTRKSPKEEPKTRTSSWSGRPPIVTSNQPLMCSQAPKLETNHELFTDKAAFSTRPPCCHARCSRLAGADP